MKICKSCHFSSFSLFPFQKILSEFNKEQEAFIKDQSGKNVDAGVCPWVGHKNEDKIKEEVINLSNVSVLSQFNTIENCLFKFILGPSKLCSSTTSWK